MSSAGNYAMALRKLNVAIASIETFTEVYEPKSLLVSEAYADMLAARIHLTHAMQVIEIETAPTERPAAVLRLVKP